MGRIRNAIRALRGSPLPEPVAGGSFVLGMPGPFDTKPIKTKRAQTDAYTGWVYAAASLIAGDLRANPWYFEDKEGDKVDQPKAEALFKRPTAWTTWGDLIEWTSLNLDLTGEAFWWLVGQPGGAVQAIQHMPASWVIQARTAGGVFVGWEVQVPGMPQQLLSPRDVIWFKNAHPSEPWRAMSPVEAFALSYNLDTYARAYGAALMQNWAQPPGILTSDQELTPEEAEALGVRWKAQRQNAETIAVLGKGATYTPLSVSIKDLAFIDLARLTREQILGIYRVPPGKLGLAEEGGTAAEHSARDNSYAKNALQPRLLKIAEVINAYLVPRILDMVEASRVQFCFESPVRKDEVFELDKAEKGLARGVIRINEYLAETGRELLPGPEGDLYMLPSGVTLVAKLEDGLSTVPQPAVPNSADNPDGQDQGGPDEGQQEGQGRQGAQRSHWLPEGLIPGLTTKDMDEAEGRYLGRQRVSEVKLTAEIRRLFRKEGKAVAEAIRAGNFRTARVEMRAADERAARAFILEPDLVFEGRDVIDDILSVLADQWLRQLNAANRRGLEDGWYLLEADVGRHLLSFELFEPQAVTIAAARAGQEIKIIHETTRKALRKTIADGIAEGTSIPNLANQVETLYEGWRESGSRAERIARTETAYAINRGRDEHSTSAEQRLGVKIYDTWLAVSDDRTREHHADAHGQRIRHGDYFNVGGFQLVYPGDSDNGAPPEEVINCRCTTASEVVDS